MKRAGLLLALAALVPCLLASNAEARAAPPAVEAQAYLVLDARTGEVLAAYHAHERRPIASITKLMTVLVVLEHKRLRDVVTIDPRAAAVGESSAELEAGEQLTVRDLVEAALIQSANDAADALALSVAPDFPAFARLMNRRAAALGLHDTHFVRPDGLDAEGEYSTAADVTKLARVLMRIRFVRDTVRKQTATIAGDRILHTWDDLLGEFPNVIGVKTGHTSEAGWCQVAAVRGRGLTVYTTILGAPNRAIRNGGLEALLSWGLSQFEVVPVVQPGASYARARLPYGRAPLGLVPTTGSLVAVRVGRPLRVRVVAATVARLPVRKGAVLGRIDVWDGGRLIGSRPLVASRAVSRPGFAWRVRWYAGRTLHHLVHLL